MVGERKTGTVRWFDPERGYGFIEIEKGNDAFVHISDVRSAGLTTLSEGQHVSFTVRDTAKGPQAENLSMLEEGSRPAPTVQPAKRKKRSAEGRKRMPSTKTDFNFGAEYLANGYFESEDPVVVYPEVLDEWAIGVAKLLGNRRLPGNKRMTGHQLRRFFNKARAIADRLDGGVPFDTLRSDILSLKSGAARAVARNVAPEEFKEFMDINIALAIKSKDGFRKGFLDHFQSVLAYFTYYFRD